MTSFLLEVEEPSLPLPIVPGIPEDIIPSHTIHTFPSEQKEAGKLVVEATEKSKLLSS